MTGALLAGLAVVLGAFAAHLLRDLRTPHELATFETGVRYQMFHALALLALAHFHREEREWALVWGRRLLAFGTVVFSGSLYLLVLTGALWLGAVTPVGGVALILGWAGLAWALTGR